jgi:hypothetical protein
MASISAVVRMPGFIDLSEVVACGLGAGAIVSEGSGTGTFRNSLR